MNIFIAGLSFATTDAELADLFQEYGETSSAKVITDRQTGRSKGYGFVEMEDDEAANKAIAALDETEFAGRKIAVSEAKPREPRQERSFNNNRGGGYGNRSRY